MHKISKLICLFAAAAVLSISAAAQVEPPVRNEFTQSRSRLDILAKTLNLSDEQKIQIVRINQMQRRQLRQAQETLREARIAADKAIYSDVLNEEDVELKIRELAMAQAEITKIRMMSEVRVRTVLTPEQLVKFRELQALFAEQRRQAAERSATPQQRRQDRPVERRQPPQPPAQRRQNPPPVRNTDIQKDARPPQE